MKERNFEAKLREAMERKRFIEERIEEIVNELSHMAPVQQLNIAAAEARTRLESFIRQNGGTEGKILESRQRELHFLKEEAEKKGQEAREVRERDQQFREERDALKLELSQLEYVCTDEEVREYQRDLEKVEQEIAELHGVINKLESDLRGAEGQIPDLGDLPRQREDLAAAIALGRAEEKDLKALDEQIAKKKDEIKKASAVAEKIASKALPAIPGLKRKLAEAERRAEELKRDIIPTALDSYLRSRLELAGGEYVQAAKALIQEYRRLLALEALLMKQSPEQPGLRTWRGFVIPGFDLKSCKETDLPIVPKLDVDTNIGPEGLSLAIQEEIKKIEAIGIRL